MSFFDFMPPPDDYVNYMGFRNMIVEEKIEECLAAARRGETVTGIDRGDLSDDEVEYLRKEVERRIRNGNY